MTPTTKARKLWVVGEALEEHPEGTSWELVGVFDSKRKARKACTKVNHFMGPMYLNWRAPDEKLVWHGVFYPLIEA